MEKVRDLLAGNLTASSPTAARGAKTGGKTSTPPGPLELPNLQVREHPRNGPFVEGLTYTAVESYGQVEEALLQGSQIRAIAATQMNQV